MYSDLSRGYLSDYTKPLEPISLRTFNKNIIDKFFSDCDTSLSILRHDELQIWGAGDFHSVDDQIRWIKNLGRLELFRTLGTSSFQPTSQPVR